MRSYGQFCAVAKALDVVGDRWTLLVVRELTLQGPCRFTDLHDGVAGIASNLLTSRLRALEEAGVVRRTVAPPPVATTLYELTESGRDLDGVLRALGRWGTRFMSSAGPEEAFRGHWLAFPVAELLVDRDPAGPPFRVEVRTGGRPAVIEASGGTVSTTMGPAEDPDVVLEGPPQLVLSVLMGSSTLAHARRHGVRATGTTAVLGRLGRRGALTDEPIGRR